MNAIVNEYRRQYPDDQRGDDEITLLLAEQDEPGFTQYSDFAADLQRIRTNRELSKPTIPQELSRGLSRGVSSLKQSAVGAGALAADIVGAEQTRDSLLKSYVESQAEDATENASAVPRVEDVKDFESGVRFALGKIGEIVPQIGEAVVTGVAGAAAGSAIAPGPGTAAGAAAGFAEGLVARQSAKALLKAGIDRILSRTTLSAIERNVVKDQLENIAAKKALKGTIHEGTKQLLTGQIKAAAANAGSLGANLLNFYGIGAGTIYGDLASREGVDNADARNAALVGGLGSALANAPLPTVILSRYFPGVGREVANSYIKRLATDAAKEIPLGATGETLDELVQIAAEKYADPRRRNTPLDDADLSRLLNAAVVGAGAGTVASPISAIPGTPKVFPQEMERYWSGVDDNRRRQLVALATRAENNQLDQNDIAALRSLSAEESNYMAAFKSLNDEERNQLTVELTDLKGGDSNGQRQKEGQGRQDVLTTEPKVEQPVATPPAATQTLSADQKSDLTYLGYDETDQSNLNYDEAVSIIAAGVRSPKSERRRKFREAANKTVEETAKSAAQKVEIKRAEAATNPNPTPEQAASGKYEKGKVDVGGISVVIETPKGELRQNKRGGEPWSVVMPATYGDIEGTVGADGDPVDVYVGDNPSSDRVWVIDQINPATKEFDEGKTFIGFDTPQQVISAYDASFSDGSGPTRRGRVNEMSRADFDKWIKSSDTKKAVGYEKPATEPTPQAPTEIQQAPAAGATAAQSPAAASLSDAPSTAEIIAAPNEQVVEWKRRVKYGPETSKAIAARMTDDDLKLVVAQWDALRAQEQELRNQATSLPKERMAESIKLLEQGGVVSLKAQTLNEIAQDYENRKAKPQPPEAVASKEVAKVDEQPNPNASGTINDETRTLTVANVDVENRGTYGSSKRGKKKADSIVEPAWFRPSGLEAQAALTQRLLSDRGTPSKAGKQKTKRLSAILDKQTGEVHIVSTYESSPGKASVTIFSEDVRPRGAGQRKTNKSVPLANILSNDRYQVVGSMRTKELTEFYHQTVPSLEQFEQQYGRPLDAEVQRVRSIGAAVESQLATPTKAEAEEEFTGEESEAEPAEIAVEFSIPEHVELSESEVRTLVGGLAGLNIKSVTDFASKVASGAISDKVMNVLKKTRNQDRDFIPRLIHDGIEKVLVDYDKANEGRTNYAGLLRPVEQSADQPPPERLPDTGGRGRQGSDRPAPTVAGEQDRAGLAQQEGDEGNAVVNPPGGALRTLPSLPTPEVAENDVEQANQLDDILNVARAAGINVEVVRNQAQSEGWYDPDNRTLTLAVGAAVGARDVQNAIHEIGHDVFANLDPMVRVRLLDAVRRVSDLQLGLTFAPDVRIRETNPYGLDYSELQEERLVDATRISLQSSGFNARDAQSYATRFVTALKDYLIRGALAVQRMFGFNESPKLALAYFNNAVRRFLAGDGGINSYADTVRINHHDSPRQHQAWFKRTKETSERLAGSTVEYDHQDNNTATGSQFNIDKVFRTVPIVADVRENQRVRIEREVAAINSLVALQNQSAAALAADEKAAKQIAELGKSPIAWLRNKLKLSNPEAAKLSLAGRRDVDGNLVEYDADKTVDSFRDQSNKDAVLEKSYRDTQSMAYRLDKFIRDAEQQLEEIEERRQNVVAKVENARLKYADLTAQAVEVNKDVRRLMQEAIKVFSGGKRSTIRAQLRVLDQTTKFSEYRDTIESLYKGTALSGKNVVEALDTAANTPTIDFTKPADEIRAAMRESGKFNAITSGDKNTNAMLATVIAVAKSNPRLMAELELRRLPSGRAEIESKIEQLLAGNLKPKPKRVLTRENSIEDRILREYSKEARKIKEITKNKDGIESDLRAMRLVEPVVNRRLDELTGAIGAAPDFTFRDSAEYHPAKPGMSTDEVLQSKDMIVLDSNNNPTDPKKLERQIVDMKQWLMERDERYRRGDLTAKDRAYQRVESQYHELATNYNYKLTENPSDRIALELYAMPAFARIGDSFATPAAQLFKKAGYHFARVESYLRNVSDGIYDKDYRIRRDLFKLLPTMDDDALQSFIDSSKILLEEDTSDLVERYADQPEKLQRAAYNRVREELLNTRLAKDLGVAKVIDRFMPQFERLLELEHEAGNNFFLGQVLKGIEVINPITGKYEAAGLKVLDPKIKILDDDGNVTVGLRRHFKKGWRTFGGRRMSRDFNQMVYAMRQSNWETFGDKTGDGKIGAAYNESPDAARAMLAEYFQDPKHGHVVQDWFLRMLAEQPESVFDAPPMEDGVTSVPADPALVTQAIEQSPDGDVVSFVENLYELHDGESDFSEYLQATVDRLGEYWAQVGGINDRYFPDDGKINPVNAIRGMSPEALIDSREIEGLPRQWFSFHKFDKPSLHKLSRLIASEVAFGRGQEYLASLLETVNKEVADARLKLDGERLKVRSANPTWDAERVEVEVRKLDGYKKLKQFEDRSSYVRQTVNELSSFFRKDNSPDATLWAGTRIAQTISRLMVNNPASAIYQMATLFDPLFRYGVSRETIKSTTAGLKRHLEESVASLVQGIGIQIGRDSEFNNRFNALNLQYAERVKRFGDEFRRWDNESAVAHGSRLVEELTSTPLNLTGSEARHVLFRPTGLFDWQTMVADKSLTDGMWHLAGDFTTRGMEFYRNHPEKLSVEHKLTEKDLGLSSASAAAWRQLKTDMGNFGIDFDQVVKGATTRNDGTVFTNEESLRLHSLAMFLVSSQSNVATMTPAAWNNNILRWMIPLLGWAWRRTLDVSGKRLGPDGTVQASALARGMVGIAAATAGGLIVSALVDKYYEELIDRKRNLRPIATPLGIIEHTARAGSTGFFGEFLNGAVNVGTGGDNRIISLDRRVVAMSSFMGIQSAIANLINQQEFDYSRVGRPLVTSIGGNGLLQYIGMANNFFGLDNVESQVSARINAQNYLRVIGRELDLSVRGTGGGGTGTSTPMTPYITSMELAAYGNDTAGFRTAYAEAIRQAKSEGFDDPVDHVKRAFSAKNPLRIVFQTPPSDREYDRILIALPEDGREAVSSAVDQFNRYAESIGAKAFEGKKEKSTTARSRNPFGTQSRIQSFRQAAFAN